MELTRKGRKIFSKQSRDYFFFKTEPADEVFDLVKSTYLIMAMVYFEMRTGKGENYRDLGYFNAQ